MRLIAFCFLLFSSILLSAQDSLLVQDSFISTQDSLEVQDSLISTQDSLLVQEDTIRLSLGDVIQQAIVYHPIIRQANLQEGFAEAEIRGAKGTLDPKIEAMYNYKEFKGTDYYDKFYSALKIPIWFPIDPKLEAYRNTGQYLDGEDFVSSATDFWQFGAGVSIPIGKGLFIDERRAMIQQAGLFANIAASEQIKLANAILYDIVKSYWDWYFAHRQYQLMQQSLSIAEELFRRVRIDYEYGEAAVVDTVQAKITYQNRLADYTNAKVEITNARLRLSIHLWDETDIPLELTEYAIPEKSEELWVIPESPALETLVDWSLSNHPEIQKLTAKQQQLEIEERWNKESLKPELNLSYTFIDAPFNANGFETPVFGENYKLGMDFSFPIFLRKERSKLQKTQLYQESISFELQQTRQEINAKIRSSYNELLASQQLAGQYRDLAENYNRLLEAEIFNIENGESDLFKLNIQQDKYIEAQIKYLKIEAGFEKMKSKLPYAAGLPLLSYQKLYE